MILDNVSIPIMQAPIGSIASVELAAAVSNAGAIGSLALTWTAPEVAAKILAKLNGLTNRPYFVNFVLAFPAQAFDAALEANVPVITLSWGHAPELMHRAQARGISVGVQVSTLDGATKALADGADFLICQGIEAGGHVQSSTSLELLLPKIVELAQKTPVVAAGGIGDGNDIHRVMKLGARAVMLGTRFVATVESQAHQLYKTELTKANAVDTAYTICFNRGWPNAAHRVLRNSTLNNWEAAGCPPIGARPGETDVVATYSNGTELLRYDDSPPLRSVNGEVTDCCLYAGLGVEKISDVPTVKELVDRLWTECQSASSQ